MRLYATACVRYHWIPEMPIMIMIIIMIIKMILKMTLRMRFFALCDRIKCAKLVQKSVVYVQNLFKSQSYEHISHNFQKSFS